MRCHRRRRVTQYAPATPLRPTGSGGAGQLRRCCCLAIGPHRLPNRALHLTPRRHERYLTYFSDRLLDNTTRDGSEDGRKRRKYE